VAEITSDLSVDARMKVHDIRHHMQRYSGSREVKQLLRNRLADEFLAAVTDLERGSDPGRIRERLESTRAVFAEFSDHDESMDEAFGRIIAIVFSSWDAKEAARISLAQLAREEVAYFHRDLRRLPSERLIFSASYDPWIEADPVQLRRLIDNLIINAAEALRGSDGTVHVEVDLHSVLEERSGVTGPIAAGNYATLTVRDEGSGLDPELAGKIFHAGYSTKEDHAGLGLTYVRQAVEDCGGCIEVIPEVSRGTAIRIYLPLVAPPE